MEYTFISKETFKTLVNNYLNKLPECKRDKALINLELLEKIKKALLVGGRCGSRCHSGRSCQNKEN